MTQGTTYTLKFDSKQQLDVIRTAAKLEDRSINYFVIRESVKAAELMIKRQETATTA